MSFRKTDEVEDEGSCDESEIDGGNETEDGREGDVSGGLDNSSSVLRVVYQDDTDDIIEENEPVMADRTTLSRKTNPRSKRQMSSQLIDTTEPFQTPIDSNVYVLPHFVELFYNNPIINTKISIIPRWCLFFRCHRCQTLLHLPLKDVI